jgi:hypothetical protein
MDRRVDITNVEIPLTVQFSYSVEWFEEPDLPWKYRLTRYTDSRFLPSSFEIQWLSISHFIFIILVVAALLTKKLRNIEKDLSPYFEVDEAMVEQTRLAKQPLLEGNDSSPEFEDDPSDAEEVRSVQLRSASSSYRIYI